MRVSSAYNNNGSFRISSIRPYLRFFAVALLAVFLLGLGMSVVHADTLNPVTAAPSSGAPNTVVTITLNDTVTNPEDFNQLYVVVQAPNGVLYIDDNPIVLTSPLFTTPELAECSIPFGGAGTLSSTGSSDMIVVGCSGSNANAWSLVTSSTTLGDFETACPNFPSFTTGTTGVGSTAQAGTYQVFGCVNTGAGGNSQTTSFTISSPINPNSVPEFPLGLGLLLVIAVPALLLLKRQHARPMQ